jgi:tetratricopeptide (TPR) repeat protein
LPDIDAKPDENQPGFILFGLPELLLTFMSVKHTLAIVANQKQEPSASSTQCGGSAKTPTDCDIGKLRELKQMKFRRKLRCAVMILSIYTALTAIAADSHTRLAIGTLGLTPETRDADLADSIEARLSAMGGFDLVERREIDAMLQEAGLNQSGIVRAKDAVRLGQMLRADQFLLGTSASINETNYLFVRLVDAKSGEIRAINVFEDTGKSVESLANEIADFVRAESSRPLQGPRNYLAIGVVQNLGVNNRFAEFPAQMRGTLTAGLNGTTAVLERDVVSYLANEIQLDMAGLTEGAGKQAPHMQFGFWIVDGFYQSYEVKNPEVELRLRVERIQGQQQEFELHGKPDEQFFTNICDTVKQALNQPASAGTMPPARKGEIAALEARGHQLIDYRRTPDLGFSSIFVRSAINPDKVTNTLDEAMHVFQSILLLDPDNNAAKMRLAGCLLYDTQALTVYHASPGVTRTAAQEERWSRANEYYREVIATGDPKYADDARINLALSIGGIKGFEMMRQFQIDSTDPKVKSQFEYYCLNLLTDLENFSPPEKITPQIREQFFADLAGIEHSSNGPVNVSFDEVLFGYRSHQDQREKIVNLLLPELLEQFPDLKPYILLTAAGEQTTTNSLVGGQFLDSLKMCEEHPESVLRTTNYFTDLSSTLEEEKDARNTGGITLYQHTFENHQYATIIAEALARQWAAQKGLAPPLTATGKRTLALSYLYSEQWQNALNLFNELPDATPEEKNQCLSNLNLPRISEELPDSAWKDKTDSEKVKIAYNCMGRSQWATADTILESIGHRTVGMGRSGPWGFSFTPVLPALVADECRAKAGLPPLNDPMRFELGEKPYLYFEPEGSRFFAFQIEGEDLWLATYSQIKRYHGDGPFAAANPVELHKFQRTTQNEVTSICVSSDYIWAGTSDDGLMELNRKSGVCRRLTMADGLFVNGISSLKLQGQSLWIAYQNGDNGAVGTLDLDSHKFSTFTPDLPPNAGANSQSFYYQSRLERNNAAPTLPVTSMTPGKTGEMWFTVYGKGLEHFNHSDSSWETTEIPDKRPNTAAMVADTAQGRLFLANRGYDSLFDERSQYGGLFIYDYLQHTWGKIQNHQGLPSNDVTAVAVDGRIAWVGGRGFVAIIDVAEQKVLRIAYVSASTVQEIQLSPQHAWIAISCDPEGYPDSSGNSRTGVYRVDRAAIEHSVN